MYEFGPFRLDPLERVLLRDGQPVPLTPKAFETLLVLVERSGHVVEKGDLMQRVWPDTFVEEGGLARNISVLRKALGEDPSRPQYIDTVPKRGYRFASGVREQSAAAANSEMAKVIERAGSGSAPAPEASLPAARRPRGRALSRGLLLLGAGGLAAGVAVSITGRPPPPAPWFAKRLSVTLPPAVSLADVVVSPGALAFSPDGSLVAYAALAGDRTQLYVRPLERIEAAAIPGTEGGENPFFSPDGRWLGFTAGGKLKKIPIEGGAAMTLCDAPELRGATWGPAGAILFAPSVYGGLSRVSAGGGTPQVVTTPEPGRGEDSHRWPQMLPGGRAALFAIQTGSLREEERGVGVLSLDTGRWRVLLQGGMYPRYAASGHLVYARAGSLFAAAFDADRLELTGPPVRVLDDVRMHSKTTGVAYFDVSGAGSLLYVPGYPRPTDRALLWVDRAGRTEPLTHARRPYARPALSPDGRRLAVTIQGTDNDIWICDLGRDTWTRLTFEADNETPIWSPDGKRVVFSSNRKPPFNLFWVPADGTGAAEQLTRFKEWVSPSSFAPDGKAIAFHGQSRASGWDIGLLWIEGTPTPRPLLAGPFQESHGTFSADGRWFAYVSGESGRREVYVLPYPRLDRKWPISTGGGTEPVWARDGTEIFYRNGDKTMAVSVKARPDFAAAAPRLLFQGHFEAGITARSYDVSPDGQRFVMIKGLDREAAPLQLVLVPDWFDELKARLRQAGE